MTPILEDQLETHFVGHRGAPLGLQRFTALALSVLGAVTIVGLFLGMLGVYRLGPLLILSGALAYTLWSLWGDLERRGGPSKSLTWSVLLVAGSGFVLAASFATGRAVADGPPAAQALTAVAGANTGDLRVDLKEPPFPRADLVRTAVPGFAADGTPEAPRAYAALAGAVSFLGDRPSFLINSVLAALAVLVMYVLAADLLRIAIAYFAPVALVANSLFILAARDTGAAMLGLLLFIGGLWMLVVARESINAGRGFIAGLLIGAVATVTVAGLGAVAGMSLYLVLETLESLDDGWILRQRRRRMAIATAAGAAGPLLLAGFDAWSIGAEGAFLIRLGIPLLAVVLVYGGGRLAWARRLRLGQTIRSIPWWQPIAVVAALVVIAGWLRPEVHGGPDAAVAALQAFEGLTVEPTRTFAETVPQWMWWYIGPVAVGAGILGWLLLSWDELTVRSRRWRPVTVASAMALAMVVWRPSVPPIHPAAAMVLLPTVVPGLLLGGLWLVDRLWRRAALLWRVAALALGIAVVAGGFARVLDYWNVEPQAGGYESVSALCDDIGRSAAVIVVDSADQPGLGPGLAPGIDALCNVPAAYVEGPLPAADVNGLVDAWSERGLELFMLSTEASPIRDSTARLPALGEVRIEELEPTLTRPPSTQIVIRWDVFGATLE